MKQYIMIYDNIKKFILFNAKNNNDAISKLKEVGESFVDGRLIQFNDLNCLARNERDIFETHTQVNLDCAGGLGRENTKDYVQEKESWWAGIFDSCRGV